MDEFSQFKKDFDESAFNKKESNISEPTTISDTTNRLPRVLVKDLSL